MPTLLRQVLAAACRPSTRVAGSKNVNKRSYQSLQSKAGHSSRDILSSNNCSGEKLLESKGGARAQGGVMGSSPLFAAAAALLIILPATSAGPRDLKFFLASNAGPANENSLLGVPNEVDTGESIGSGEKVNVCKFPLGSVNNWNLKPYIQYAPEAAQLILETSGRGSFIAPAVGFLHYGPSCYLYDHVCNFNYQEPCNLRGDCQTNNTCFCTDGYKTCVPNDGTVTSASAGCETYVFQNDLNCGDCGVICPSGTSCNGVGQCTNSVTLSPPPPPLASPTPSNSTSSSGTGGATGLQTPGSQSSTGTDTPAAPYIAGAGSGGAGPSTSTASGTPSTGNTGSTGDIAGATDASSTGGAASTVKTTAGMTTVPGSNGAKAAREAARRAADAAATAGRRLLAFWQGV